MHESEVPHVKYLSYIIQPPSGILFNKYILGLYYLHSHRNIIAQVTFGYLRSRISVIYKTVKSILQSAAPIM